MRSRLPLFALVPAALFLSSACRSIDPVAEAATAVPDATAATRTPSAVDPFGQLAGPTPNPTATPYVFETGPHVPKPDSLVKVPFPPANDGGKPPATPVPPELKVIRTQPTGKGKGNEALIGAVTATFNQPMIPLEKLDDTKAEDVPLVIEPKVPGRFRWLGTTTISFEPEGRMPFATEYTAKIPAGTKSALGKTLAADVTWKFETPRPKVIAKFPGQGSTQATPDTVIGIAFNQKMDAQTVAAATSLVGPAGHMTMTVVAPSDWPQIKGQPFASWDPQRSVVLRPKEPLPKDSGYTVEIAPNLAGAEGPLKTTKTVQWGWRTYAPLRVSYLHCGYDDSRKVCPPNSAWVLAFNNPLDGSPLDDKLTFSPKIDEPVLQSWGGSSVSIDGPFEAATKYTLTVSADVTDAYGQKLGAPWTGTMATTDAFPSLDFAGHGTGVSEAKGNRTVAVSEENVTDVRLRIVKVKKSEIEKYRQLAENSPYYYDSNDRTKDPIAGVTTVVDRPLKIPASRNKLERIGIPLDEALGKSKTGLLYLDLYCPELAARDSYAPRHRGLLVEVTDVGLNVKYDSEKMVVFASGIDDDAPLSGVDVEIVDQKGATWFKGTTGADGTLDVPGPRVKKLEHPPVTIRATSGDDLSFLYVNGYGEGGWVPGWGYQQTFSEHDLSAFLFTDRGIYRPEETVHLKGILRTFTEHPGGGISALPDSARKANWTLTSPRGEQILKGESDVGPYGSFTVDLAIPRGADLGYWYVNGNLETGDLGSAQFSTSFQVQEYRTPEYKVSVDVGSKPYLFGQTMQGTVQGSYYFGAPLAGAEVSWTLSRAAGYYAPPGNDGFTFGDQRWMPYSWYEGEYDGGPRRGGWNWRRGQDSPYAAQGSGLLGPDGKLLVEAKLERGPDELQKPDGMYPWSGAAATGPDSFTLEATVFDQNRQSISGRSNFVVHPSETYVGMRLNRSVIKEKEKVPLDLIATAIDGSRIETGVDVSMVEQSWKQKAEKQPDGTWKQKWTLDEKEVGKCSVKTGKEPKPCDMVAPRPGSFVLKGTAKDAQGRVAQSSITLYVYGEADVTWRTDDANHIELVADKKEYVVGDVAKVLVKSPFPKGEGLVSYEANGMIEKKRLSLDGAASVIEVPITQKMIPNVYVSLSLDRGRLPDSQLPEGAGGSDLGRPSYAFGTVSLAVSKASKTITVAATPSKTQAGPGETISLAIDLKDDHGKAVQGEAAVMLVDEGVLALLGYQTPDPLSVFWADRGSGAALEDLRAAILKQEKDLKLALKGNGRGGGGRGDVLEADEVTTVATGSTVSRRAEAKPGAAEHAGFKGDATKMAFGAMDKNSDGDVSGGEAGRDDNQAPVSARTLFASTAFYAGSVVTDADGHAKLDVKLPDNLTTFRIMVIAADKGDRFGHVDGQVNVRKPLLVRPSLPRFLDYGDQFEASMVVHNESGKDAQIELIARGSNVGFDEPARKAIFLKTGTSTEVRWKAHAIEAGTARVQFAASMPGASDAAELSIPVKLPATGEAFATYGTTEGSVLQPVKLPADVIPSYGSLSVQTSSTALTTLGDALDYLYDYPYECLEQTASRILPIFALKDVIHDFKIGKASDEAAAKKLAEDGITRISSLQNWDGGFRFWPESERSDEWISGYATFVLLRGKEAGYKVPENTLARAKQYLLQHGLNPPKDYGEAYRRAIQAQAVMVLTEMGEKPESTAQELYDARAKLPIFSRAELLVGLFRMDGRQDARVVELLRLLDNSAVETASTAHYAEQRTESLRLLMHSEARTDAIVLWTMTEVRPDDSLIPKVVKGLNDSRIRGRWRTTQENAWVLLAMSRYYHAFEKKTPDFVAKAWLEDRFMGETAFAGRTMAVKRIDVPMSDLIASAGDDENLVIAKDGPGRLYYRLGLTYAPKDLKLKPEEQGFSVSRVYEPVDDKTDVTRDDDGTWKIKAGSTVKVRLTIVVPDRRYFAAIVDPLPAGLEAENTALATTKQSRRSGEVEEVDNTWSWYSVWAFNHTQMRDDRVEIFADDLPTGVYQYTYLARATSLGNFVVPPLKAEEMYAPETFGRNGTMRVVVQ